MRNLGLAMQTAACGSMVSDLNGARRKDARSGSGRSARAARWALVGIVATSLAWLPAGAFALDIQTTYDSAHSSPPTEDADGALLSAIVERAAEIWEAAFPDTTSTVEIEFHWEKDAKGFLGIGDGNDELGRTTKNTFSGKYTIRFFTHFTNKKEIPWFMDATPEDDVEFNGDTQYLLRAEVSGGGGVVMGGGTFAPLPKALEISYGFGSAEGDAQYAKADLLSNALHEMGHALGLNFWDSGITSYYDVDSSLCDRFICSAGGGTCSMRIPTLSSGAHLDVPTLMGPNTTGGIRLYPSQVDILAVANVHGWSVNFPRMEMLSPATSTATPAALVWDDVASWFGDRLPSTDNDVNIRWGLIETVDLYSDGFARNLNLGSTGSLTSGSLTLKTGSHRVYAADTVTIDNDSTELFVDGGAVQAEVAIVVQGGSTLHLKHLGQAQVFGDRLQIVDGDLYAENGEMSAPALLVEADGTLWGSGTARSLVTLRNDGLIRAYEGDLYFTGQTPESPFDLDGDAFHGEVEAISGGIAFEGSFPDDFSGDMRVGAWVELIHPNGWSLGTVDPRTTTLSLEGDDASVTATRTVVGSYGVVNVSAARTRFASDLEFQSGCTVNLASAGASLGLLGDTEYEGGSFTGNGTLYQVGDAVVLSGRSVQIDAARYMWDGQGWLGSAWADSRTTVEPYASLRITKAISSSTTDGFDGVVQVQTNAVLYLDRAWKLDGDLCLDGGTVRGGTITVTAGGTIRGTGKIEANVVNLGTIYCDGGITFTGTVTNLGTVTADCPACP